MHRSTMKSALWLVLAAVVLPLFVACTRPEAGPFAEPLRNEPARNSGEGADRGMHDDHM